MSAPPAGRFGPVQRIAAGVLEVGYVDTGPPGGRAVLLLHGWPYDIYSYADAAPALAEAGYRVIVPYLRGYGSTRFLSADAPRNGQQAVLAVDAIARYSTPSASARPSWLLSVIGSRWRHRHACQFGAELARQLVQRFIGALDPAAAQRPARYGLARSGKTSGQKPRLLGRR